VLVGHLPPSLTIHGCSYTAPSFLRVQYTLYIGARVPPSPFQGFSIHGCWYGTPPIPSARYCIIPKSECSLYYHVLIYLLSKCIDNVFCPQMYISDEGGAEGGGRVGGGWVGRRDCVCCVSWLLKRMSYLGIFLQRGAVAEVLQYLDGHAPPHSLQITEIVYY